MKKTIAIFTILIMILGIFTITNKVYAADKAIDEKTESKLVEIKEPHPHRHYVRILTH